MTTLYKKLANGKIVLMTFLLVAVFAAYLFPTYSAGYRQPTDPDVIALQLSFTHERFSQIVSLWLAHRGVAAIQAFQDTLVRLDIAFPIIYAIFLASLFARQIAKAGIEASSKHKILMAAPFLAALMDLIENSIHYSLFSELKTAELASLSPGMILGASIFAGIKMALIGVSLIASGYYAVRRLQKWLADR